MIVKPTKILWSTLIDKLSSTRIQLRCDLIQCSLLLGGCHLCHLLVVPFLHYLFSCTVDDYLKFTYLWYIPTIVAQEKLRAVTILEIVPSSWPLNKLQLILNPTHISWLPQLHYLFTYDITHVILLHLILLGRRIRSSSVSKFLALQNIYIKIKNLKFTCLLVRYSVHRLYNIFKNLLFIILYATPKKCKVISKEAEV